MSSTVGNGRLEMKSERANRSVVSHQQDSPLWLFLHVPKVGVVKSSRNDTVKTLFQPFVCLLLPVSAASTSSASSLGFWHLETQYRLCSTASSIDSLSISTPCRPSESAPRLHVVATTWLKPSYWKYITCVTMTHKIAQIRNIAIKICEWKHGETPIRCCFPRVIEI